MRFFNKTERIKKDHYKYHIKILYAHIDLAKKTLEEAKFGDPFYNNKVRHLQELESMAITYEADSGETHKMEGATL